MMTITFVSIILGWTGIAILFLLRNNFTYRTRIRWNEAGYQWALSLIKEKKTRDGKCWMDGIHSYDWILYHFWLWNMEDFIKDPELFAEINPLLKEYVKT
jgi:hypothetical protein